METTCYNPTIRSFSIFDEATSELFRGLEVIDRTYNVTGESTDISSLPVDSCVVSRDSVVEEQSFKSGMTCSLCQVVFDSLENQRDHFKLDWHRYNLKQRIMGKPVVTEDVFEETVSGDMSSLSGSDTETDDDLSLESSKIEIPVPEFSKDDAVDNEKILGRHHPKIFLINQDGSVLSIFQTIIYSVKSIPQTQEDLVAMVNNTPMEKTWIILMTAGGHFAAAVFSGSSVVCHKTFHRYTVRAKRGTAQGARDNQQGGKQPKSAGASLRRYNETALLQEVQDLLESWDQLIENANRIFIRVPNYNKSMFFGGKKPPFKKDDPRLRTIPFVTRRPTFNEVRRVHAQLSAVEILGSKDDVLQSVVDRLQSVQTTSRTSKPSDAVTQEASKDSSGARVSAVNSSEFLVGNQEDPETGVERKTGCPSPTKSKKKGKGKKTNKEEGRTLPVPSPVDVVSPRNHLWNRLYCACVAGNIEILSKFLFSGDEESRNSDDTNCKFQSSETYRKQCLFSETSLGKKVNEDVDSTSALKCEDSSPRNHLWNRLYCACVAGNVEILSKFLFSGDEESRKSDDTNCKFQSSETYRKQCLFSETSLGKKVNEDVDSTSALKCEDCNLSNDTERTQSSVEEGIESSTRTEESVSDKGRAKTEIQDKNTGQGLQILNEKLGENGGTLLHAAARSSQMDVVQLLLCNGGDPAIRDDRGKTPYNVASNKETRNEFRRFMALYPTRFDYKAAQIPSPLTAEAEDQKERKAAERKKVQRKARKEKQKEQKLEAKKKEKEEVQKREEEKERRKFMALSEREKRALAAERRFAQQQASVARSEGLSCSYCSKNLTGQVPFERLRYKYCSTSCVREHRKALECELKTNNR